MTGSNALKITFRILGGTVVFLALVFGVSVGVAIASTKNQENIENFTVFDLSLPTRILDIKGRVITQFVSAERREMVSIKELPQHLIDAFVTREDDTFWTHRGFTLKSYFRALWGVVSGQSLGGGSTITTQLAGVRLGIRKDISLKRKLVELWYALQLERRYSKQEILEQYLNLVPMGPSVYGVEAACKYFFGHSAREATLAESAIIVIQLASPTKYNPLRNPQNAKPRSKGILDEMAKKGFVTKEAAEASFNAYWDNFDYTRDSTTSFNPREDKAPWFSEYVRRQLVNSLYGSIDIYRDGLTVNTTLDLDQQVVADRYMSKTMEQANKEYKAGSTVRLQDAEEVYAPISEMLGLAFNLENLFLADTKIRGRAMDYYQTRVNPSIDALALLFGMDNLKSVTNASYGGLKDEVAKNTVEGALITIDNDSGYITALVGGSRFEESNQNIRATQGGIMPGSAFKPLFYSAAIDSRLLTAGSLINDSPVVFYGEDNTPYIPRNYGGVWRGNVLLYQALALSLNIPALQVLDKIGFDRAISRASALLDISDPDEIRRTFPRYYPLALGTIKISPLKMARAYAVFANQGKEVAPIAIRSIEDRNGRVFMEPEKELRVQQKKKGVAIQVVTPQNAYIMTELLQKIITYGTMMTRTQKGEFFTYKDGTGKDFIMPMAAKTGTTDNWADAWTIGYSPYMTTAVWFGFDRPGNSLGVNQYGEAIAGYVWANYMKEINKGLSYRPFAKVQSGIVQATVCVKSGFLPTDNCNEGIVTLPYLEGTQPKQYCELHQFKSDQTSDISRKLNDQGTILGGRIDSTLDFDLSELDAILNAPPPGSAPPKTDDGATAPDETKPANLLD